MFLVASHLSFITLSVQCHLPPLLSPNVYSPSSLFHVISSHFVSLITSQPHYLGLTCPKLLEDLVLLQREMARPSKEMINDAQFLSRKWRAQAFAHKHSLPPLTNKVLTYPCQMFLPPPSFGLFYLQSAVCFYFFVMLTDWACCRQQTGTNTRIAFVSTVILHCLQIIVLLSVSALKPSHVHVPCMKQTFCKKVYFFTCSCLCMPVPSDTPPEITLRVVQDTFC